MKVKTLLRGLGGRPATQAIPDGSLLRDPALRDGWRPWFAEAARSEGAAAIFARHPRRNQLPSDFSIGAYLAANPDVADAVANPSEAVFHYLEFGLPEGRSARADQWDAQFVRRAHGLSLPETLSPPEAAAALQSHGVPLPEATLSERDHWLTLGLHGPALAKIFNHDLYRALLDAAGHALPAPDRLSCIAHFAETGLDAGIPAHPDHMLDRDFYRASIADLSLPPPSDADLPRHWARIGLRAGIHANPAAWTMATHDLRLPEAVRARIPSRSAKALARIIADPAGTARRLDAGNPDSRRFLVDLARVKRGQGAPGQAKALLEIAHAAAPADARVALDLADIIHATPRGGKTQTAREIALRRIPPADFDSGANRVTLAELELAADRIPDALDLAETLPPAVQGDVALRRRVRTIGRAAFEKIWNNLSDHIDTHSVDRVQRLLTRAITLYAPPPDTIRRSAPIRRVAILANDDLYQCKLYRADQKADQLRAQGITVRTYLQSRDVAALHADLPQFDAVIFQRNPAFPDIADVMVEAARRGLATFYDIDDLIFDAAQFPPPLDSYGGQITAAQHAAMACGVPLFAAAAALCDTGIASTEPIREALAPLTRSGTAFTHRNALGAAHMAAMRRDPARKSDKLVLFYGSGTKAHKADFTDILEPALARVLAERPGRVEVRLMGDFPDLVHLDPAHPDISIRAPIWDFESYAAALSEADIALSVLSPSAAADAKSELKWTEPAMFGIPAITSPTRVLADAIEDGATGLLATDTGAFATAMLRLLDDASLRARIGEAAKARVLRDYALEPMGASLLANLNATRSAPAPRLLVVNVFYPPQDIGGATRVVADNVRHLLDHHDFEIDVLTTLEGGPNAHEVSATSRSGARVWSITAADHSDEAAMTDSVMDARIEALLDRIAPDIVHVHCLQRMGVGIIDLCRRRGIPYVLTLHDGWWASPNQFIIGRDGTTDLYDFHDGATRPPRAEIARRCLLDAAALLAVSEPFAALHRDIGLPHARALPNGVSALPAPAPRPGPPGRVRLGLIGGAARHKGFDLLRAALTSRPFANLDLLIVDHALPSGAEVAERWNTTPVRRIPRLPQADVAGLYGSFDVLLAPSVWPESYGLVAREALALGLWVIASDQGAMGADVQEGVTGHIVSVDDHRALADVLARIDADPARYGTTHGTRVALRSSSEQAEELAALYRQILGRR